MPLNDDEITSSEIDFLKCITAKDLEHWLETYNDSYPLYKTAIEKHDDTFFLENRSLSGYKKYLKKFPQGKHVSEARVQIYYLEEDKKDRKKLRNEQIENIGFFINIALFIILLFGPMIAGGWSIGETFALAISFAPIYYGIYSITKNRK